MLRAMLRWRHWCGTNRRNALAVLTFLCALCVLLWQRSTPKNETSTGSGPRLSKYSTDQVSMSQTPSFNTSSHNRPQSISTPVYNSKLQNNATNKYLPRQLMTQSRCQVKYGDKWKSGPEKVPAFENSPLISTRRNFLLCPVGKVASTFFTRFVLAMSQPGRMMSPYLIPLELAGRARCESLKSLGAVPRQLDFLHKSVKTVFGRNPFSRIFSAYIDKLFSPNPFYWGYWGKNAMTLEKLTKITSPCFAEVPFQKFVQLTLKELIRKDVHLRPVSVECHMCDLDYDVIAKVETTEEDIDYIASLVNISSEFQHEEGYDFQVKMDIVYDSVKSPFGWKQDILTCMSLDQMGLRIWRKLQIRGVIDSSIPYPFKSGEIDDMPAAKFISACKNAILASTDKAQLKKQKNEALMEAYSELSVEELAAISKAYEDDIKMFGYDPRPVRLFENRESVRRMGCLNWREPWEV